MSSAIALQSDMSNHLIFFIGEAEYKEELYTVLRSCKLDYFQIVDSATLFEVSQDASQTGRTNMSLCEGGKLALLLSSLVITTTSVKSIGILAKLKQLKLLTCPSVAISRTLDALPKIALQHTFTLTVPCGASVFKLILASALKPSKSSSSRCSPLDKMIRDTCLFTRMKTIAMLRVSTGVLALTNFDAEFSLVFPSFEKGTDCKYLFGNVDDYNRLRNGLRSNQPSFIVCATVFSKRMYVYVPIHVVIEVKIVRGSIKAGNASNPRRTLIAVLTFWSALVVAKNQLRAAGIGSASADSSDCST